MWSKYIIPNDLHFYIRLLLTVSGKNTGKLDLSHTRVQVGMATLIGQKKAKYSEPSTFTLIRHLTQILVYVHAKVHLECLEQHWLQNSKMRIAIWAINSSRDKVRYIHTVEVYMPIRINELKIHIINELKTHTTWMCVCVYIFVVGHVVFFYFGAMKM